MSIIELGALGEFLGSIGVIATLIYLAVQIRQNTHSLDDGRKLAMAQTYEARASRSDDYMREHAESPYLGVYEKYQNEGLSSLTTDEQARVRHWSMSNQVRMDNFHYQYEQGFLDDVYYESIFMPTVRSLARQWKEFGFYYCRPSFRAVVERILAESEENEQ